MSYASTILADSPRAYYRLNETSGTVARDNSGNGYDGTLTGVSAYSQGGALVGETDTSILFTASGGLTMPYTLNYTTFSAFSLEFWSDASGRWQHVAITCDGSTTIIYVNAAVDTPTSGAPIVISSIFDVAGSSLASRLDEIAVYNYVLTPAQIQNHYGVATILPLVVYTIRRDSTVSTNRRDNLMQATRRDNLATTTRRDGLVTAIVRNSTATTTTRDNSATTKVRSA